MSKEIIILADGDFPSHEIPLSILKNAGTIICCDGAAEKLINYSVTPYAIVGDMDSLSPRLQDEYKSIIHKSEDQETNDLTKAFLFALKLNPQKVIILGATGKREDHTLGNISLLAQYKSMTFSEVEMYTDFGIFIPVNNSSYFNFKKGSQISIFALNPHIKIASKGLKYPTSEVVFDYWWKATLNEVSESPFYIEFEDGEVIIFSAYN